MHTSIATLAALALAGDCAGAAPELALWPADAMRKVFRDAAPPEGPAGGVAVDAARNEVVSAQAVLRCEAGLARLRCRATPLTRAGGTETIPAPDVRYVDYLRIPARGAGKDPGYMLRKRPCAYPDALRDAPPASLAAGTAQPLWLTLRVPEAVPPGRYAGSLKAEAAAAGGTVRAALPVEVRVHGCTLPDRRTLWVTNWQHLHQPREFRHCGVEKAFSEAHWRLLAAAARNMAAHRQSAVITPLRQLIGVGAAKSGRLAFDFGRFDRWVKVFRDAGVIGRIEGSHLAWGRYGSTAHRSAVWTVDDGRAVRKEVGSFTEAHREYLEAFLPALQSHLARRGWLDAYTQHVFDEPTSRNAARYRKLAGWVKAYAPRVRIVEACETEALAGAIDIWVPKIHKLARKLEFYRKRRDAGEEVWFYTCCDPTGNHLNRFIEFPLTRVRLLHWANYAGGATGYLHWGWDHWDGRLLDDGTGHWQPGDAWLVYPGKGRVLDSIRSEAMLEGIQDYELLKRLAEADKAAADAICGKLVRFRGAGYSFRDGVDELRAARRELLEALSRARPPARPPGAPRGPAGQSATSAPSAGPPSARRPGRPRTPESRR